MPVLSLTNRIPKVDSEKLLSEMIPPKRFAGVSLENFHPSPLYPSQAEALEAARSFGATRPQERNGRWVLRRSGPRAVNGSLGPAGLYLDGGFGVGKTHLLVGLFFLSSGSRLYTSFSDLTYFVGALGFNTSLERLSRVDLLCIDEFELDDPGDTVLVSNLCNRLVESGVRLAVTSNTLPERLGEGRFAAEDFMREIQGLAKHFVSYRMDGPDYRHRSYDLSRAGQTPEELERSIKTIDNATLDDFDSLVKVLGQFHPTSYRSLVGGLSAVGISDMRPFADQSSALRFVAFVDRLYDLEIGFLFSGCRLEEIFPESFMRGGFRKKYGRAISRLASLSETSALD